MKAATSSTSTTCRSTGSRSGSRGRGGGVEEGHRVAQGDDGVTHSGLDLGKGDGMFLSVSGSTCRIGRS